MDLKGKAAIVTGGAQGIGKAIATRLAASGADLVIPDVNLEAAKTTAAEIEQLGVRALALEASVTELEQMDAVARQTVEAYGNISILVNNAGITRDNLLLRMKDEEWRAVLDVNLRGAFVCTKAVLRQMLKQRWGRIVNIASVVGIMGNAGQCNYAASKAGLIGFTKSAARELGSRNITVNAVAPGYIQTAMTAALNAEQTAAMKATIPLQALGSAEDVAGAVAFFVGRDGCYVTGHVLNIDGGMAM